MEIFQDIISVIVPSYNVEPYIQKCISSILNQSYRNIEIILVDDGSTDKTGKVCDQLAKTDARIRIIHKRNGGLSDARNAGIDIASGKWLAFVDGDDYLSTNALEAMHAACIRNDCDIAVCNIVRVTAEGKTEPFYEPVHCETVLENDEKYSTLKQPSVCNKLFKAGLFDNIRFPVGKYYEDTFVYHELVFRARRLVLTGENGYWYLKRNESIIDSSATNERYFDFIEAVYKRMEFLHDKGVEEYSVEAGLSLYGALSNAYKRIPRSKQTEKGFELSRRLYHKAYKMLIKKDKVIIKQKIRLFLLDHFPSLHTKLF